MRLALALSVVRPGSASREQIITRTSPAQIGPYEPGDLPTAAYVPGVYASSAGTIASVAVAWFVNGLIWDGVTALAEGDVVTMTETVTDSASNVRAFSYGPVALPVTVQVTWGGAPVTWGGAPVTWGEVAPDGDADAAAYLAAVEVADGQALEPAVRAAVEAFVVGCKADGIWSGIASCGLLMGARTLAGAMVPIKGPAITPTAFVAGDYNRSSGLLGNGSTKFLTVAVDMSASERNTDAHLSAQCATVVTSGRIIGQITRQGGLFASWHIGQGNVRMTSQDILTINAANNQFLFAGRNSGGNVTTVVGDATPVSTALATIAVGNENPQSIRVFDYADGVSTPSASRIRFFTAGRFVDPVLLRARANTLIAAIQAAVV